MYDDYAAYRRYYLRRKTDKKIFLIWAFNGIVSRLTTPTYKGCKLLLKRDDLINRFINDREFNELYKN